MSDDIARIMIGITIAVFAPPAFYFRLRSHTGEKLNRWQEGAFVLFGLRLGSVPWLIGGAVWLYDPLMMRWSHIPLPAAARWAGLALWWMGGTLLVWTFYNLGANLTDTVVTREQHTLITTGPYRLVRHPFYVAFLAGVIGSSLLMANWFLLAAGLVPFSFVVFRTKTEEAILIQRFGNDYRNYMARTGAFFPKLFG